MVDGSESLLTTYILYPNYQCMAILTYIWFMFMATVGKYTFHRSFGIQHQQIIFLVKSQQVHPANARPLLWSSGNWRKKSRKNFQSGVGPPPNRNNEKLHRNAGPIWQGLLGVKMNGDVMRWGCNVWQFDLWRWFRNSYMFYVFYLSVLNCLGTSSSIFALSTQIII